MELVVALGQGRANISVEQALDYVFGYALGIDLTRRDLQAQAKEKGRPWEMSKGFDQSAPISAIVPVKKNAHPVTGRIWLSVNGVIKQDGDLQQMTWNVAEVVANLSTYVELAAGDLIFTGTPEGVGPLVPGDVVHGEIEGVGALDFKVTA